MATTNPTFESRPKVSDFLKMELDQRYNREAYLILGTGAAIAQGEIKPGHPFKISSGKAIPVLAGDEANATHFYVDERVNEVIAQNATSLKKYQFLRRGPALINKSMIPALDPAGGSLNAADLVTAAAALSPPILTLVEGSTTETQTN